MSNNNSIKAILLLADYGHDPTETAIPYKAFRDAGFEVSFATEHGKTPECDQAMLTGWTQKLLGAAAPAIKAYDEMCKSESWQHPLSWTTDGFTLSSYDLVFLPGGHEKGVRQILDSQRAQKLLADYFPRCKRSGGEKKCCGAICHGVQALAHSTDADGRSVLHDVATTALPGFFEDAAYGSTRLFLGDYYKTYGAGTPNVEGIVKAALNDPEKQWRSSVNPAQPYVVEDEGYRYMSGRWPGDAELLASKVVQMVKEVHG